MTFSPEIKEKVLVDCGRCCVLCHKFCGIKIELHHAIQESEGGEDSYENCIPLCFDCHGDMRSYDHKHPKGTKYTPSELKRHRDSWYSRVKSLSLTSGYSAEQKTADIAVYNEIIARLPYSPGIEYLENISFTAHDDAFPILGHLRKFMEYGRSPLGEFIEPRLETLRSDFFWSANSMLWSTHLWNMHFRTKQDEIHELADKNIAECRSISEKYRRMIRECKIILGV